MGERFTEITIVSISSGRHLAVLLSLFAFLSGGAVYLLYRSPSLRMFEWLESIHAKEFLLTHRPNRPAILPDWFVFAFPDGCWIFSYILAMGAIWSFDFRRSKFFLLFLPFIAVASEIAQGVGLLRGTFDTADLIAYLLGTIVGFVCLFIIKKHIV